MGDLFFDKRIELLNLQIATFGKISKCAEDFRKSALLHNLLVRVQVEQRTWQSAHLKAHELMRCDKIKINF